MKLFGFLLLFAILGFINSPGTSNPFVTAETNEDERIVFCSPSFDPEQMNAKDAPLFKFPGTIHYPVTTTSLKAQQYFDQGLTLLYAFNHGEAGRSFKAAIDYDSTMTMAYWGLAMVLGPNYNAALNPSTLDDINYAIDRGIKYSKKASKKEQQLIAALATRFPRAAVDDMSPFSTAYANAMAKVYEQFPGDDEVAAIYADALMNEHPWNFWLKDGSPQPWTPSVIETLEKMLAKWPEHPAIIHMYIHATEASLQPEKAIPYADRLGELLPAAGHIVHMPSHTYIRTGDYHKAVLVNEKASMMDSTYIAQCKVQGSVPLLYYPHNIHFLAVSAFLEGNARKALDAAWMIQRNVDREQLPVNVTVQHYFSIPFYTLVQLGKWDEILESRYPGDHLKYPAAIWHYARGMAFTAQGKIDMANDELAALQEIAMDQSLSSMLIWETNSAAQLIAIANLVLSAEILASGRNYDEAFSLYEKAVAIEDALNYQEPPDWFFSVRHSYGHWLVQAEKFVEAEKIYRQDINIYKENGWALMGLYNALKGQGRPGEAFAVRKRFDEAWKWSDLKIHSSRVFN